MNVWLKRGLWLAAVLVVGVAVLIAVGLWLGEQRRTRMVPVQVNAITLPSDAAALERGRYLFASRGCGGCHGANGAGSAFIDDGKGMKVSSPNISPGAGNVVAAYKVDDWVRVIRHGVKPNAQPVFIMPSQDYNRMTDADTGALIAYTKSLAPTAGKAAAFELPLPVRVLYGLGQIPDAASRIDHSLPPATAVAEALSVEHGLYVAQMCKGCHGEQFAGGKVLGGPPDWPPAARLSQGPDSVMPRYADTEAFKKMFKTGKRPDGSAITVMPFETLREMSDVDVGALHLYLKSLQR